MNSSINPGKPGNPSGMPRRALMIGLSMMVFAMTSLAVNSHAQQDAADPIRTSGLHSFALRVSDVERSVEFYQGLFGMPVLSRIGDTVSLQVGDGPEYFTVAPTRPDERPHIAHFGLSVPDFNIFGLQNRLAEHGISRTVSTAYGSPTMDRAGLSWTAHRPGNIEGDDMVTDYLQLFIADRDGIPVQLSSERDCGGRGRLGTICEPEPAQAEGLIRLQDINHFTSYVANYQLSNAFYRDLFGFGIQAYQGTFPLLDLGEGPQFLMFVGGTQPGEPAQPGRIDHASLNIHDFSVDSVLESLTEYGLSPRPDGEEAAPLQHWVVMRMPERGGAPGGTPEVYFSDPDGIHIQLQHRTYCGGGGELGSECGM